MKRTIFRSRSEAYSLLVGAAGNPLFGSVIRSEGLYKMIEFAQDSK